MLAISPNINLHKFLPETWGFNIPVGLNYNKSVEEPRYSYLANDLDEFKDRVVSLFKNEDLRLEFSKNCKKVSENFRHGKVAKTWIKIFKFVIDELYPLRYYGKERKERVNLVKEFIHKLPIVSF